MNTHVTWTFVSSAQNIRIKTQPYVLHLCMRFQNLLTMWIWKVLTWPRLREVWEWHVNRQLRDVWRLYGWEFWSSIDLTGLGKQTSPLVYMVGLVGWMIQARWYTANHAAPYDGSLKLASDNIPQNLTYNYICTCTPVCKLKPFLPICFSCVTCFLKRFQISNVFLPRVVSVYSWWLCWCYFKNNHKSMHEEICSVPCYSSACSSLCPVQT